MGQGSKRTEVKQPKINRLPTVGLVDQQQKRSLELRQAVEKYVRIVMRTCLLFLHGLTIRRNAQKFLAVDTATGPVTLTPTLVNYVIKFILPLQEIVEKPDLTFDSCLVYDEKFVNEMLEKTVKSLTSSPLFATKTWIHSVMNQPQEVNIEVNELFQNLACKVCDYLQISSTDNAYKIGHNYFLERLQGLNLINELTITNLSNSSNTQYVTLIHFTMWIFTAYADWFDVPFVDLGDIYATQEFMVGFTKISQDDLIKLRRTSDSVQTGSITQRSYQAVKKDLFNACMFHNLYINEMSLSVMATFILNLINSNNQELMTQVITFSNYLTNSTLN